MKGINVTDLKLIFAIIGANIGYFIGRFIGSINGMFIALLVFVILDYLTGILKAIYKKELSSSIGYKGICRKVFIFLMVGIANVIDVYVLGSENVIRSAVILFYISNEGISIIENASEFGLPIPSKLKDILKQLKSKSEEESQNEE